MKEYTEEQKTAIGTELARIFRMRKSHHRGRFQMDWGDKTPLGLFNTFQRIAEMIGNGEEVK